MDQMAMAAMPAALVGPFAPAATVEGDPPALAAPAHAAAPWDAAAPAHAARPPDGAVPGWAPWAGGVPTPGRVRRAGTSDFDLVLAGWLGPGVPPGVPVLPGMAAPAGGSAPPGGSVGGKGAAAVGVATPAGLPLAARLPVRVGLSDGSGRPPWAGPAAGWSAAPGAGTDHEDGLRAAPVGTGEPGCGGAPPSGAAGLPVPGARGLAPWRVGPSGGGGGAPFSAVGDPVPAGVPDRDAGGGAVGWWQSAPSGGDQGGGGIRIRVSALAPAAVLPPRPQAPCPGGADLVLTGGAGPEGPGNDTVPCAAGPGGATPGGLAAARPAAPGHEGMGAGTPAAGGAVAAGGYGDSVREAAPERRRRAARTEPREAAQEAGGDAGAGAVSAARTEGAAAHLGGDRAVVGREPGADHTVVARDRGPDLLPGPDPRVRWPGHRPAEVELEVDAGDLGQVTVRVAEHHGTVAARFLVEGSTVSQLLERSMPELHARLEQAGLVPGQLEVSLGGSGDRGRRGSPSRGQEPLRVGGTEPVARPAPAVGASARGGAVVAPAGTGRGLLDVLM